MLRRLARGRRGSGGGARRRGADERPERRARAAAYGLALFGVLGMGLAAAVATWPLDVLPQATANASANADGTGPTRVVAAAGAAGAVGAAEGTASPKPDMRTPDALKSDTQPRAAAVIAPDLLFPKPSLGPPRQFPLKPTPSPPPTKPAPPPPSQPAPPPPPKTVAPKPVPPAPVVSTTPSPTPAPTKTPVPRPAEVLPLPAPPYHVLPHKQLSRVLVVFVVGIVPVSLARVRR